MLTVQVIIEDVVTWIFLRHSVVTADKEGGYAVWLQSFCDCLLIGYRKITRRLQQTDRSSAIVSPKC